MLALFLAVMAAAWLVEAANDKESMHIHGSVVFVRTGERTPILAGADQVLTALGAQQMHTLGQNFRTRYVNEDGGPDGLGVQQMPVAANLLNNDQLLIQTLDTPYLFASAQAFMQGLYPPYSVANSSATDFPMDGYQYAQIHTVGQFDAQSVYIGGNQNCPVSELDSAMYEVTEQFLQTKAINEDFYSAIDVDLFDGHLKKSQLDYMRAVEISEYLSYAYQHDSDVYEKLNNKSANAGVIDRVHSLADEKTWYEYGNTSASSEDSDNKAMGGKTLSALILGSFQKLVDTRGKTSNGTAHPLTLLFGEHEPMVSLFSLMMVDYINDRFRAMPPYGSAIVFELYSTGSDVFPSDSSDLKVQFYYQNGTDFSGSLTPHPMFGHGPSVTELPWTDFQDMMSRIMVNTLEDWCSTCNSPALFCWGVDESVVNVVVNNTGKRYKITPTVAGVIGAIVTLVVAGLIFGIVMLLGGIRFHRVSRKSKSDLGGFKGSAKLASDADLSIAKNAAAPGGAGIVSFGGKDGTGRKTPHERVGSWELRQKEFGRLGDEESPRGSFDGIESAIQRPVEPHVRI